MRVWNVDTIRDTMCKISPCDQKHFFLVSYFFVYLLDLAALSAFYFSFSVSGTILDSDVELSYYVYYEKMPPPRIRSTAALHYAKCHESSQEKIETDISDQKTKERKRKREKLTLVIVVI